MPSISRPAISVPIQAVESREPRRADGLGQGVPKLCARGFTARRRAGPAVLLVGAGRCQARLAPVPDSSEAWKLLGQIELFRERSQRRRAQPAISRSFDPVLDLSMVRATYALRRASELAPRDFSTLLSLRMAYDFRLMNEAALPLVNRLASLYTTNLHQSGEQAKNEAARAEYLQKLGSPPATTWRNLSELDQIVTDTARRRPRRECGRFARAGLSAGKSLVGNDRQDGDLAASSGRAGPGARALAESDDAPAGHTRRANRHDLPRRRRLRRRPPTLPASDQSQPELVRGTLLPGRARTGCRPCPAGL